MIFSSTIAALVEPVDQVCLSLWNKTRSNKWLVFDVCIVNSHYIGSANCQNILTS
jgi:hypothetical protein